MAPPGLLALLARTLSAESVAGLWDIVTFRDYNRS
jgi:hypothetical protein